MNEILLAMTHDFIMMDKAVTAISETIKKQAKQNKKLGWYVLAGTAGLYLVNKKVKANEEKINQLAQEVEVLKNRKETNECNA